MAGQTTWNKATVPAGTDPWNGVPDWKKAAETSGLVFGVANATERNGLAATAPGGVLPIPTLIFRADVGVYETWDGTAWQTATKFSLVNVADTNWSYVGQLSKATGVDGKGTVTLSEQMARVGAGFTINTTYLTLIASFIPAGFRPAATVNGWALMTAADESPLGQVWWRINTAGDLTARLDSGTTTFATGNRMHLMGNWTTA